MDDPAPGSESTDKFDLTPFASCCQQAHFRPGDVLRVKGQHYREMYLIAEGSVGVDLGKATGQEGRTVGPGSPIGEIAFLRGCAATATVTANSETSGFVIDDATLLRLEREQPALVAHFLRQLAVVAEERISYNVVLDPTPDTFTATSGMAVYLCRSEDMLLSAQRLRYEVYCQELHRQSPYADHEKKVITDDLDETGHVFVVMEKEDTIGTLRLNLTREGPVGLYEELYRMNASPNYPKTTAICTKFIVTKSRRGSEASLKLISAVVRYGSRLGITEIYIDCIPALAAYYEAMGFVFVGPPFFHRENGPSFPMKIDFATHGKRVGDEHSIREYMHSMMRAKHTQTTDHGTQLD